MPLREGFDYPLPKTSWGDNIKGGKSVFAGKEARGHQPGVKVRAPPVGTYKAGESQDKATMPQIKGTCNWSHCPPRFKDAKIQKTDLRNYNVENPSRAPKWNFGAKGPGHKVATIRTCGADVFYNPVKDYVDCAEINGVLVQGAVQGMGSRVCKVADFKNRTKSESRVKNYPQKPGPGQ